MNWVRYKSLTTQLTDDYKQMERVPITTENNNSSPLDLQIDMLLNRFSDIIEHTQVLVFPSMLKGITIPPDVTNWSKLRRFAFVVSSPSLSNLITGKNSYDGVMLITWLVATLFWYIFARMMAEYVIDSPPTVAKTEQPIWAEIAAYFVLSVLVLLALAAYWRWIEFFRDQRYLIIWRIILFLVFLAIMAMSAIFFPHWLFFANEQIPSSGLFYAGLSNPRLFIVVWASAVIPASTFLYMLAIESLVLTIQLLRGYVMYVQSAHNPFFKKHIRELALEAIESNHSEKREWRLVELTQTELEVIREWARENREGSDKRLLPTVILFAILSIFANTKTFSNAVDGLLIWLYKSFSLTSGYTSSFLLTGQLIAASLIVFLILWFLYALLLLFRNLVVQTLIIETCIIVDYAQKQCKKPETNEEKTKQEGFWRILRRLFW